MDRHTCNRCRSLAAAAAGCLLGLVVAPAAVAESPRPREAEPEVAESRSTYIAGMVGSSTEFDMAGGPASLFTGEAAVGVAVPRPGGAVRLELEGRRRSAVEGTEVSPAAAAEDAAAFDGVWTATANLWRDVEVAEHLGLYAGGGLGMGGFAPVDRPAEASSAAGTALAWQVGGGATYAASERLCFDIGYRFYAIEAAAGPPPAGEVLLAIRLTDPLRGLLGR